MDKHSIGKQQDKSKVTRTRTLLHCSALHDNSHSRSEKTRHKFLEKMVLFAKLNCITDFVIPFFVVLSFSYLLLLNYFLISIWGSKCPIFDLKEMFISFRLYFSYIVPFFVSYFVFLLFFVLFSFPKVDLCIFVNSS